MREGLCAAGGQVLARKTRWAYPCPGPSSFLFRVVTVKEQVWEREGVLSLPPSDPEEDAALIPGKPHPLGLGEHPEATAPD